jgi:hypothetical protein
VGPSAIRVTGVNVELGGFAVVLSGFRAGLSGFAVDRKRQSPRSFSEF